MKSGAGKVTAKSNCTRNSNSSAACSTSSTSASSLFQKALKKHAS